MTIHRALAGYSKVWTGGAVGPWGAAAGAATACRGAVRGVGRGTSAWASRAGCRDSDCLDGRLACERRKPQDRAIEGPAV
ncbi:hypothetical protein BRAS3843_250008 [Bradyrhizobium sp. STM 3843]|nr:hypothetical protein BRAS3843_250008 [Bradyrhizobium sp. STM 3843]